MVLYSIFLLPYSSYYGAQVPDIMKAILPFTPVEYWLFYCYFIDHNGVMMRELDNKNKKSDKTKYFYKKVSDGKVIL